MSHEQLGPAIQRPNGKYYRARKTGLVIQPWEDDNYGESGVFIFGTLDIEEATPVAKRAVERYFDYNGVSEAHSGWFRTAPRNGELTWITDPVRGRPGCSFTATDL